MKRAIDQSVIDQLQEQILKVQGHKQVSDGQSRSLDLGMIEQRFPGGIFPRGAVHELISTTSEAAAVTSGFLSVLLEKMMQSGGFCLWISTLPRRSIYPPALKAFGIDPERFLFVDTSKPRDTLWALEECLKCDALVAVVGELTELSFNESRRLQLATESSQVTGFIHRFQPKAENATACVSRWKITPLASQVAGDMPGLGFPQWQVQLLKVRNGHPGEWQIGWTPEGLRYLNTETNTNFDYERQIG